MKCSNLSLKPDDKTLQLFAFILFMYPGACCNGLDDSKKPQLLLLN